MTEAEGICFDCDGPIIGGRYVIEVGGVRTYFHRRCYSRWKARQRFKRGREPKVVEGETLDDAVRDAAEALGLREPRKYESPRASADRIREQLSMLDEADTDPRVRRAEDRRNRRFGGRR